MNLHNIARKKRFNPRQILDEIIYRWSPWSMTGQQLDQEELLSLFEAARQAPSSSNNQPWRFYYAVRHSEKFKDLLGLLVEKNRQWCINAACLIIVVSKKPPIVVASLYVVMSMMSVPHGWPSLCQVTCAITANPEKTLKAQEHQEWKEHMIGRWHQSEKLRAPGLTVWSSRLLRTG